MKAVSMFLSRRMLACGLVFAAATAGSGAGAGETAPRLAIKGYDPVAYFTPGQPTPGSADITYDWDGARWPFANTANRDQFQRNPDAYAPQYGGYCALGMTTGNRGEVNPEVWAIVDGKLYLNYERSGHDEWRENQAANIAQADQNWAKLKR
jgi:hypothetical protein